MRRNEGRRLFMMAMLAGLGATRPAAAEPDVPPALADALGREGALDLLARLAVGADEAAARAAQQRLRAAGPAGLAAFERAHAPALAAARDAYVAAAAAPFDLVDPSGQNEPARARLLAALDGVCAQKDCVLSRLYWHTDLDAATRAAQAEGKPILSLRLLGRLGEELSCANSRFFRAVLYPDPAVAALLRARFVLHWSSERPAPKIAIDYGDGRTIETTITGNSIHYVLDAAGRPVDALPGLYAPKAFVAALTRAEPVARQVARLSGPARAEALARWHAARLGAIDDAWQAELAAIGERRRVAAPGRPAADLEAPRAGLAAPIAMSKMVVERPMLGAIDEPVADEPAEAARRRERISTRHAAAITLAPASVGLMRTQQWRSGDVRRDAADFAAAQDGLRRTLALDTLRNEHELHRTIHTWWVRGAAEVERFDALNRRVYAELFLTPRSDPWLGLADPSAYAGLTGGGRRTSARL